MKTARQRINGATAANTLEDVDEAVKRSAKKNNNNNNQITTAQVITKIRSKRTPSYSPLARWNPRRVTLLTIFEYKCYST